MSKIYRTYLADAIQLAGENTARLVGGSYLKTKWSEISEPKPEETRSAKDVINHMKEKLAGLN